LKSAVELEKLAISEDLNEINHKIETYSGHTATVL